MDERELDPGGRHPRAGVLQLPRRVVQPDRARPSLGEQDRPLRSAAPELEYVLARDVSENLQLRLRRLPDAPARLRLVDEVAVPLLVIVARPVPVRPVTERLLRRLSGQPRSPRRASAGPIRPARSRSTCGPPSS